MRSPLKVPPVSLPSKDANLFSGEFPCHQGKNSPSSFVASERGISNPRNPSPAGQTEIRVSTNRKQIPRAIFSVTSKYLAARGGAAGAVLIRLAQRARFIRQRADRIQRIGVAEEAVGRIRIAGAVIEVRHANGRLR